MSDHSELIERFTASVSCDEQQARFYLEANNWDLNAAVDNYYEHDGNDAEGENAEGSFQETRVPAPHSTASGSTQKKNSQYATLRDYDKEQSDEEEEEEVRENLFAGGEKSGIFMQKPGKPRSLVDDILKKATEGGRGYVEEPETTPAPHTFTGTGYKLGSDEEPSVAVNSSEPSTVEPPRTVVRHLTFWRDGFSIEDGPLMAYDDPANEEFLKAINNGRAPLTWLNVRYDQPVDIRVERRLDEDYKPPPKQPIKPFSGSGQRLGSPTPTVATSSTPGAYPSSSSTPRLNELVIDESLPITSIQIRLGDGTRMLARFNHTHTVSDIRNFINASRVGEATRNYVLQTTFPSKDLKDELQTLTEASLLNAVVVQRYT
ncbi:11904_t:CDS:10 [Dentiscutata heterogama]|uniref:11904_t:CDS:1 n=1 Tax=Dentiscutata heterogama TaxID=1316150 RepID=A0ACA9K4H1_9GLOM|nr:11904_t:CDS:10 [Dentiscutata heterogama]